MSNILEEFNYRKSFLQNLNFEEAEDRILGFLQWIETTPETITILTKLRKQANRLILLEKSGDRMPPKASTPEEIAAVGLELMEKCKEGEALWRMSRKYALNLLIKLIISKIISAK